MEENCYIYQSTYTTYCYVHTSQTIRCFCGVIILFDTLIMMTSFQSIDERINRHLRHPKRTSWILVYSQSLRDQELIDRLNDPEVTHYSHSAIVNYSLKSQPPNHSVIEWSSDQKIQWSNDPVVEWSIDRVTEWSSDRIIQWSIDPVIEWSSDRIIQWSNDPVMKWSSDPVIECPVIEWSSDRIIEWLSDPVID